MNTVDDLAFLHPDCEVIATSRYETRDLKALAENRKACAAGTQVTTGFCPSMGWALWFVHLVGQCSEDDPYHEGRSPQQCIKDLSVFTARPLLKREGS